MHVSKIPGGAPVWPMKRAFAMGSPSAICRICTADAIAMDVSAPPPVATHGHLEAISQHITNMSRYPIH